jgi:hypothetical protein
MLIYWPSEDGRSYLLPQSFGGERVASSAIWLEQFRWFYQRSRQLNLHWNSHDVTGQIAINPSLLETK